MSLIDSQRHSHCHITITLGVEEMPLHTYKTNGGNRTSISAVKKMSLFPKSRVVTAQQLHLAWWKSHYQEVG
jgi:hypothetical protein